MVNSVSFLPTQGRYRWVYAQAKSLVDAGHEVHILAWDRLLEAPDADTMGPMLAARLKGDELVVLKGSRGVTLERILPAILPRAATTA